MADKANNKNSAEKPNEVSLKTSSDFYSSSYLQPKESSQEHSMQGIDGNLLMFFQYSWEIYCKTSKHG